RLGRLRTGHDRADSPRYPALHADEGVPPPLRDLAEAASCLELDAPVDRDGVVDARDDRQPEARDAEVAVGEYLVVVDDIEVVASLPQRSQGSQAERQRLGKIRGPHPEDLEHVDPVAVLA